MSGSIVLNTLEQLGRIGAREQVLGLLDDACQARLANLLGSEWVSLSDHLMVYQATLDALGPPRAYEVWRDTMLITLQKGLYSKLWSGLGRVNKGSPLNFYRHSGAGWAMATKGCGVQTWQGDQGRSLLMWSDLPRPMVESVGFCTSMRAKIEAVLVASRVEGSVKEVRRDLDAGALHLQSTWRV
jgi:hypothetical protein